MGYIYKITNQINGELYVGRTIRSLKTRFTNHLSDMKRQTHESRLYNAMKKYGSDNFIIELIEETDEIDKREQFWIAELSPSYNLTKGGDGGRPGYKHKEETKKKIAASVAGKSKSQEQRSKQSLIMKAKYGDPSFKHKTSDKSVIIDNVEYKTGKIAAKKLRITCSSLCYRLKSSNFPNYNYKGKEY